MVEFRSAGNRQAYLKCGILGFQGSGKTFTASQIAIGLHKSLRSRGLPGGDAPVYFLDTETGGSFVDPLFKKEKIELLSASSKAFADLNPAIDQASKSGGILMIDSITHFWHELMDAYKKRKRRDNLSMRDIVWLKDHWRKFSDAYVNAPCHIIMCGRAGWDYDYVEVDDDGKKQLTKTGVKMKAESETGYEPSLLVRMEQHQDISRDPIEVWCTATIIKDRWDSIHGKQFRNPKYKDFSPHIEKLNLGGTHEGVDNSRTSDSEIPSDDWKKRSDEKGIVLDEIKELLVKHFPGTAQAAKKGKGDYLEKHTNGIRAWSRVETLALDDLQCIRDNMRSELEKIEEHVPTKVSESEVPF